MHKEQEQAARRLTRALQACRDSGLTGGVFEGRFCLWPSSVKIPHNSKFFTAVEEHGKILDITMQLDGGAGS